VFRSWLNGQRFNSRINGGTSDGQMVHNRKPFLNAGEDRRPALSWPRLIPLDGESPEVVNAKAERVIIVGSRSVACRQSGLRCPIEARRFDSGPNAP
jgi:hypothetical protein